MAVSLAQLSAASAGPALTENTPPTFLSVGNSLMWGQGLLPEHRFRELVRSRIARETGVVPELAMARSGAVLEPQESDAGLHGGLLVEGTNLSPWYSPENFAREMPSSAMSIQQQLESASELILRHWGKNAPQNVRWILLDGGINDIGIFNILTPFRAELDGYALRCWPTWLLDEAVRIEDLMLETLQIALRNFPSAVVVVNGYFPVFSLYSVASVTKLNSVGFLYGISNLVLTSPFGLDAVANASNAWQAASAHHLRRAIRRVLRIPENADRTVLFARSNIEGPHSLFGPSTWLWGYDAIPDGVPENASQWAQWSGGATPEDEVISERINQCNANQPDFAGGITCRIASIGHPNVPGAVDYAEMITDALEQAGVLQPEDSPCMVATRGRLVACRRFIDEGNYRCFRLDARACTACSRATNTIANAAEGLIKGGASRFSDAGKNFEDAAGCFEDTQSGMAQAAAGQFSAASGNFNSAADNFSAMADCWDDTQNSFQNCDDEKAAKIAECNSAHENRVNTTCNIQCSSFTNCNRFGRFDPRRYACRVARVICVAAAATARGVCRAASVTTRELCKAAAEAAALLCKGGEVAENTGCTLKEGGKGIWEGVKGVGHALTGVGAALGALGSDLGCALGNAAKGLGNAFLGAGEVILGTAVGLGALGFYLGCSGTRWVLNRTCRIAHGTVGAGCYLSNAAISAPCVILNAITRPGMQVPR